MIITFPPNHGSLSLGTTFPTTFSFRPTQQKWTMVDTIRCLTTTSSTFATASELHYSHTHTHTLSLSRFLSLLITHTHTHTQVHTTHLCIPFPPLFALSHHHHHHNHAKTNIFVHVYLSSCPFVLRKRSKLLQPKIVHQPSSRSPTSSHSQLFQD